MKLRILLFILAIGIILLINPVSAEDIHKLTVNDKRIDVEGGYDSYTNYIIDTVEFGELTTTKKIYNQIWIKDKITVDFDNYRPEITEINGKAVS
jgi:hypothetical protein